MVPSARQALACVLFIFIAAVYSRSQVAPATSSTATISGKVTLKNKGLAGIVVAARFANRSGRDQSRHRATTDETGKYRITNIPPGTYEVAPLAPSLVQETVFNQKSVVIEEGDNIEDVNFSMIRGGVITGRVTDADGRPVVEEQIFLLPVDGPYAQMPYFRSGITTDDRGVYRAFGLSPGKYKVYVGQGDNRLPGGTRLYPQTFYPSVTDEAKASVIEVTESGEATGIDIVMGRPITAYKVTGKIVESETGKPVPNVSYGIATVTTEGSSQSTRGASTNANGEFKFEGVLPGKYSVFIAPGPNTEVRAEPVPFEVVDHDLMGLVVKTSKGLSVSGVVVLEGTEDPSAIAKLGNLYLNAMSERREAQFHGGSSGMVKADGTFRLGGLSPGVVQLGLTRFNFDRGSTQLALVRIERDGIHYPNKITIKDGEHVTGLRLIVKTLTATIRGQVKIEDGELPAKARMSIWIRPVDDGRSLSQTMYMNSNPQIDSRGRFVIEGVAGGTYEINVGVFESDRYDSTKVFKQQVTVADNSVSEVTVTIKLKP